MHSSQINHLPESAGRLLTSRIPVVPFEATIADVERMLVQKHGNFDTISYIYVVDRAGVLMGVLTIKNVFRLPKLTHVKDVIVTDIISVRSTVDQEKVVHLALQNNLKAVPVLDNDDKFLGVISSDTLLSILYQEGKEDLLLHAGVGRFDHGAVDPFTAPVLLHARKRLPWLLVGAGGGIFGALIISNFGDALAAEILLAAFIPALVDIVDGVGTQTEMLFVQAAAGREKISLRRYLKRELQISFLLSMVLGLLLCAVAFFWFHSSILAITVGLSILLSVMAASVLSVLVPWALIKLRRDPAVASAPFILLICDLLTVTIYFLIAETVLKFLT